MVAPFSKQELLSVVDFSSRVFTGNTFLSNATETEKFVLNGVNKKLKTWSEEIAKNYAEEYGPFDVGFPIGNPIQYNTTRIKVPWAGVFKGNSKKQYSAQVSIVANPLKPCLEAGFYFGAAASHDLSRAEHQAQLAILNGLGASLSKRIQSQNDLFARYQLLFRYEFLPYVNNTVVSETNWLQAISTSAANCCIKASIEPDSNGEVTYPGVDSYLGQLMFLMLGIGNQSKNQIAVPPLTPQQWARQAQRLAIIGFKGEEYIMQVETRKMAGNSKLLAKYPRHVALESNHYGFDILSFDPQNGEELFIEVKTTTQKKLLGTRDVFYMSTNEYDCYQKNKSKYRIYRVYDVESSPTFVILDPGRLSFATNEYVFSVP